MNFEVDTSKQSNTFLTTRNWVYGLNDTIAMYDTIKISESIGWPDSTSYPIKSIKIIMSDTVKHIDTKTFFDSIIYRKRNWYYLHR